MFRSLNSLCTPIDNPTCSGDTTVGSGICSVLSVDAAGNVILVKEGGGVSGIGFGYCQPGPLPQLVSGDAGIDLKKFNLFFAGNPTDDGAGNTINAVGIGYNCSALGAKLDLFRNYGSASIVNPIGLRVINKDQGSNYYNPNTAATGIKSLTVGPNHYNLAGDFEASFGSSLNIGLYSLTDVTINPSTSANIAIYGDLNITPSCASTTTPCTGPSNLAGYFNGDLLSTTAIYVVSDSNLKQNIQDIIQPMTILNALHPKSYQFNQQQNQSMQLESGTHFGILASELNDVLPQLTKDCVHPARYDSLGNMTYEPINFKAVNYIELIPYLIAAVKQQDSTIHALQDQINNCCAAQNIAPPHHNDGSNGNGAGNGSNDSERKLGNNIHSIELSSENANPIIYQNIPNPFNQGGTKIRYFVPDNANNPQIIFYDEFGSPIKTFTILETGMGELNVTANNLSSGVYSYSLIINGKVIDTKRMVFQK